MYVCIDYISEGSVSNINGVWPVFPLKQLTLKLIGLIFITCSRRVHLPYKRPVTF